MKRQNIIIASFLVLALTGWALLGGVSKTSAKPCSTACQKETTPKASSGPSTGFFIVDSFSGIL